MVTHSNPPAWRIPMDRGAWWATAHGVRESGLTELLSSSNHVSVTDEETSCLISASNAHGQLV